MTNAEFLAGRILLAMPGMGDRNFARSVIPLYVHDETGAFGIGIGHARDGIMFHDVLREMEIEPGAAPDCVVHHGGPVEPGRGFVLHTPDWEDESTLRVDPLGAFSSSVHVLQAIARGEGPEKWLISLGYSGWGAGQLDDEMHRHGWYAAQGRQDVIFDHPFTARWNAAWQAEGINPGALAGEMGHA